MAGDNWQLGLLREIAQPVGDKWFPSSSQEEVSYVGLEHISPENPKIAEYGKSADVISTKNSFKAGDTLFGKLRPYLKKVALADISGVCSTDIIPVRANPNAHFLFLYYLLSSPKIIAKAVESSAGNVMPRASWSDLADIEIAIPPLPEQKKIAEILSGIDESIHIHQQKIEDLSTLLRELLREHYQERCENSDLHLEKVIRLPIQYGANASATKLQSGEPRYIRITDIKEDGELNELNAVGIDLPANDWNNYLLREGDLLLARTGNTIGKSYLHKRKNEELVFAGYPFASRA